MPSRDIRSASCMPPSPWTERSAYHSAPRSALASGSRQRAEAEALRTASCRPTAPRTRNVTARRERSYSRIARHFDPRERHGQTSAADTVAASRIAVGPAAPPVVADRDGRGAGRGRRRALSRPRHPDPARARHPAELHARADRDPAAPLGPGADPVGPRGRPAAVRRAARPRRDRREPGRPSGREPADATNGTCAPRSATCASPCRAAAWSSAPRTCCAISRQELEEATSAGRGQGHETRRRGARLAKPVPVQVQQPRRRPCRRCARWADRWSRRSRPRAWWWSS